MQQNFFESYPAYVRISPGSDGGTTYPPLDEPGDRDTAGNITKQGYLRLIQTAREWVAEFYHRSAWIMWSRHSQTKVTASEISGQISEFPISVTQTCVIASNAMGWTSLAEDLIQKYCATNYRVEFERYSFALRIGQRSFGLKELYDGKFSGAVYLTACNFGGRALSDEENASRHAHLMTMAGAMGLPFHEGAGLGDSGDWPAEPSVLILGLDLERAMLLGRTYEQNAIVWAGPDATPKLVLLR